MPKYQPPGPREQIKFEFVALIDGEILTDINFPSIDPSTLYVLVWEEYLYNITTEEVFKYYFIMCTNESRKVSIEKNGVKEYVKSLFEAQFEPVREPAAQKIREMARAYLARASG